jgi:ubiquinone/menaquinone biosynthesis C-methylase UbiE
MKIKGFSDTIKWYDKNARKYAKAIESLSSQDYIEKFANLLPKGSKVLDAGCAAGRDSKLLADKGLKVVGVDLSKNLLNIAKENNPDIKFVEADFRELPFANDSFDGIWSSASLLHLETVEDVKKSLSEFTRVLKDNRIICIMVKAKNANKKFTLIKDKLSNHYRFFQFFTKEEISNLLQQNEFKIISIEQYNETEKNPKGRPEVEWIVVFGKKRAE